MIDNLESSTLELLRALRDDIQMLRAEMLGEFKKLKLLHTRFEHAIASNITNTD